MIITYLPYVLALACCAMYVFAEVKKRKLQNELKVIIDSTVSEANSAKIDLSQKDSVVTQLQTILTDQQVTINHFNTKYEAVLDVEALIETRFKELSLIDSSLKELNDKYVTGLTVFNALEDELSIYSNEIEIMNYGLYKPLFDFTTSEEFKDKIEQNYLLQKAMIKDDLAAVCHIVWEVNGNKAEGRKMTKLNKKNMLYAFNGECDALIAKIKWNNATKSIERLQKSFEAINKLGTVNSISITRDFYNLKLEELKLTYEYENKKQDEKEEQRRIREQMREEEKVVRDIERAKKEADEEERRYQKALTRVKEDLRYASKEELDDLNSKLAELEVKLKETEEKRQRALSMAQQTRAGHIYIISNIGSFGENVYKIGMTRRLEPLDRVRELGDASVPFRYDVHAVIYSENAPTLENELHKKFHDRRLNRVNGRKEFFRIDLSEIETFVKEHANAEIEFTLLAEAQEYRETMSMIAALTTNLEDSSMNVEKKFPVNLL